MIERNESFENVHCYHCNIIWNQSKLLPLHFLTGSFISSFNGKRIFKYYSRCSKYKLEKGILKFLFNLLRNLAFAGKFFHADLLLMDYAGLFLVGVNLNIFFAGILLKRLAFFQYCLDLIANWFLLWEESFTN